MWKSAGKTMVTAIVTAALVVPAAAVQVRELGWADLVRKIEFEDPFEALTPDQIGKLGLVARVRALQAGKNKTVSVSMRREAEAAEDSLKSAGVDIDTLLARREEIRELRKMRAHSVVTNLHGQQVRMPGYALPLEYDNRKITEFLLVPWVGACIHTPPPPPNQIVWVQTDEGVESRGRFTPVWVTGEMQVHAATKDLYLVDGSAGIDVGYTLQALKVEPYR